MKFQSPLLRTKEFDQLSASGRGPRDGLILDAPITQQPLKPIAEFVKLCESSRFCGPYEAQEIVRLHRSHPEIIGQLCHILQDRNFSAKNTLADFLLQTKDSALVSICLQETLGMGGKGLNSAFSLFGSALQDCEPTKIAERAAAVANTVAKFYSLHPQRSFPESYFEQIQTIFARSKDPARDCAFILTFADQKSALDCDRLHAMYDAGFHSIPHQTLFARFGSSDQSSFVEEKTQSARMFRELLSRTSLSFTLNDRYKTERLFDACAPGLQPYILQIAESLTNSNSPLSCLTPLLSVLCNHHSLDRKALFGIVSSLPHFENKIAEAVNRFCKLAESARPSLDEHCPAFRTHRIEVVNSNNPKWCEVSPQESLNILRLKFLSRQGVDGQTIDTAELDLALKMLPQIKERVHQLKNLDLGEIDSRTYRLHSSGPMVASDELRLEFLALAQVVHKTCINRSVPHNSPNYGKPLFGYQANDTQLLTALLITAPGEGSNNSSRYTQMLTGEGKTLTLAYAATYFALTGQQVHVLAPSLQLGLRDTQLYNTFYAQFGIKSEHFDFVGRLNKPKMRNATLPLPSEGSPHGLGSITYSTERDLIFARIMARQMGLKIPRTDVALVDEADSAFHEGTDIVHQITGNSSKTCTVDSLRALNEFVELKGKSWLECNLKKATEELFQTVPGFAEMPPPTLALYIKSALLAPSLLQDRDYVIRDEKVVIVDVANTGRLLDTMWMHGLSQLIALKHDLIVTPESRTMTEMSVPTFLSLYSRTIPVSGTIGPTSERNWLKEALNLSGGFDVPPHETSRAVHSKPMLVETDAQQEVHALQSAKRVLFDEKRSMILTAPSIAIAKQWHLFFKVHGFSPQLLTDFENLSSSELRASEQEIVRAAGKSGTLTIVTTVAGRGTDFRPSEEVRQNGGMHEFIGFLQANPRLLRQIQGRVARQGDMGSSETVASYQSDPFILTLPEPAQKLLKAIVYENGPHSPQFEASLDLLQRATTIGKAIERRAIVAKDKQMASIFEAYYNLVQRIADESKELVSKDSLARTNFFGMITIGTKKDPGIENEWGKALERMRALVHNHRVFMSDISESHETLSLSERSKAELIEAYTKVFNAPYLGTEEPNSFLKSAQPLMEFYQGHLAQLEFQSALVKSDTFEVALESLIDEMSAVVRERAQHLIRNYSSPRTSNPTDNSRQQSLMREREKIH